jgi:hypothetical protein
MRDEKLKGQQLNELNGVERTDEISPITTNRANLKYTGLDVGIGAMRIRAMHYHRADDLDILDLILVYRVEVVGQHDKVRALARRDRSFDLLLTRVVGAVEGISPAAPPPA